jgi:hypothetical protein
MFSRTFRAVGRVSMPCPATDGNAAAKSTVAKLLIIIGN